MTTEKQHSTPGSTAGVVAPASVVDRVCGMTVAADTAHRLDREGTTYLFLQRQLPRQVPRRSDPLSLW